MHHNYNDRNVWMGSITPLSVARIHDVKLDNNFYAKNYSREQLNASAYNPKLDRLECKSYSSLFNKTGAVKGEKRDLYRGIYSNQPIDRGIQMLTPTVQLIKDFKPYSKLEISRVETTSTEWGAKDRQNSSHIKLTETSTTTMKRDWKFISDVNISKSPQNTWK